MGPVDTRTSSGFGLSIGWNKTEQYGSARTRVSADASSHIDKRRQQRLLDNHLQ